MTKPKTHPPAILTVPKLSGDSHKLTLGQIWFAAWRALPRNQREPWSRTELAHRLGVDRRTTYDWEKNPEILATIRLLGRRHGESEYGRVLGAVVREAIAGSFAHARLYFELMGDLGQEAIDAAYSRGEASVQIGSVHVLGDVTFDQRRLEVSPELADKVRRASAGDGHSAGSG